jgi:cyanophycinase-like exopeptidase
MNACLIGGAKREPILCEALNELPDTPRVLVVPSACSTQPSHHKKVATTTALFNRLNAQVDVLHDYGIAPTPTEIAEKFGASNMIYTIGGNSPYFMRTIKSHGTDVAFRESAQRGTMLAGVSAGALAVFAEAHSCPVSNPAETQWDFIMIPMLGLVRAAATAHANVVEPTKSVTRLEDFISKMPASDYATGFGVDNGAAILLGENSRILRSDDSANVSHVYAPAGGLAVSRYIEDAADLQEVLRNL